MAQLGMELLVNNLSQKLYNIFLCHVIPALSDFAYRIMHPVVMEATEM